MIKKSNADAIRKLSEPSKKIGDFDDDDDTDLSVVEDDQENSNNNNNRDNDAGKVANDKNEEVVDLKIEAKKRKLARKFDEDLLIGKDGLTRIYEDFPRNSRLNGGRGYEAEDIKRLTSIYKEWIYQLHPGFSFQDALMRSENLGSKGKVRHYLDKMRDREKGRYLVSVYIYTYYFCFLVFGINGKGFFYFAAFILVNDIFL